MTYEEMTGQHSFNCEYAGYPSSFNDFSEDVTINSLNFLDSKEPIMNTNVLATRAWHRVIHKEIDPRHLRPYLGWRSLRVVKKTLARTTQMARMSIRYPLR